MWYRRRWMNHLRPLSINQLFKNFNVNKSKRKSKKVLSSKSISSWQELRPLLLWRQFSPSPSLYGSFCNNRGWLTSKAGPSVFLPPTHCSVTAPTNFTYRNSLKRNKSFGNLTSTILLRTYLSCTSAISTPSKIWSKIFYFRNTGW